MKKKSKRSNGPKEQKSLSPKNKLVPLFALASLALGLQTSTQYFAHVFHYAKELGSCWQSLYWPWSIVLWWQQAYDYYPRQCTTAGSMGAMVSASGLLGCALAKRVGANSSKINETLHGSARWADAEDLKNSSLLHNNKGVYVGAWIDLKGQLQYLRHNGPEHILTLAPTRSGKGVSLVLPTLLSWPHSVVITDLKGELWEMTAGWRKTYAKNKVIRFEPASLNSARWNPIDAIRLSSDYEVGDAQNLGTLIVDPEGKGLVTHWQKTSQALLIGLILHAVYKLKVEGIPAHFPSIDAMLANQNLSIADLLTEMTQYPHVEGKTHPVVYASARDMIDRPEEEAGSVLSTLKSFLALYRCPIIARNVSASDFDIKDLMRHDSPVSLYIVTKPGDKVRLQPLVRVMLNMIVRTLADDLQFERVLPKRSRLQKWLERFKFIAPAIPEVKTKKTYKHRLLAMIDEFPTLGKLDILQESLAFVAGYGIKFYLICQDLNQLKSHESGYGPNESITSNCHIQNAFPPNRLETADHLSKLTGLTTIVKEQITTSGKRTSMMLNQVSRTFQEVQRPLLTADECMRLPGPIKDGEDQIKEAGDMIIYLAGFPMIYGKQALYFNDPQFKARAAVPPPLVSDILRTGLSKEEEICL
ncbi:MAG: type IV secretory system conjugative DNA transfer family protein [Tatlockia sp.]|nr:type IV secretory system conjugative DNA transfer family protein [Tatlockia sp.]